MKLTTLFLLLFVNSSYCFVDPLTAVGVIGLGYLGYNFDSVKKYTYCLTDNSECCIDDDPFPVVHIPADYNGVGYDLQNSLFGQHIVINQLIPALRAHWNKNTESKKPLVISFHGTPGTGKNYVSDFIAKRLFRKGLESKFVHKFLGRADFPVASYSNLYSAKLVKKVREEISKCPRSLFIFDEVDKMPPGVFEALTSLLDHHSRIDGHDFRKATFIFLSNTAGVEISKKLADLMQAGYYREQTKLSDFEKVLEMGAYNMDGGLKKASIIETHLIDHFIPFLPLEKEHLKRCIRAEFASFGYYKPSEEEINSIIDNYVTFDQYSGLFATTGCKRLSKKVEIAVYSKYRN